MIDVAGAQRVVVGLFGAGGFAREVMPLVRDQIAALRRANPETQFRTVFVEAKPALERLNGELVLSEECFYRRDDDLKLFNVAIGNSVVREEVAMRAIGEGIVPLSIIAESALSYDEVILGPGAIVCANTMVTSNARIGRFFHANIYSYVAHDCVIGDFVTFAPRVSCNGNVFVGDHAYIGTGAVLKQGQPGRPLVIGEGAVVGMGAVVTRDVPPHATVVGNPARPMEKK